MSPDEWRDVRENQLRQFYRPTAQTPAKSLAELTAEVAFVEAFQRHKRAAQQKEQENPFDANVV